MNPAVDQLLTDAAQWREELQFLRALVLEAPLVEEVKWGQPCYTHEGKNIAILGGFKNYFVLSLMKGVDSLLFSFCAWFPVLVWLT